MRDEPLAHPGRAAKQHEEQKAADRGRQHHRNRKDRIEQALDATRGTHSLPRGEQAQRKGDQQGKAARFYGHPKRAIVDVAQKGSQRGQGPLLIPHHDRRCFYHLSAIKPTRAALGITRGRCNHHIAVPIRATLVKAIGIPASIKRCFRRDIPRKVHVTQLRTSHAVCAVEITDEGLETRYALVVLRIQSIFLDRLGRYPHHNAIGSRRHYKVHVLVNGKPVALRLALHDTGGPLGQPLKTLDPIGKPMSGRSNLGPVLSVPSKRKSRHPTKREGQSTGDKHAESIKHEKLQANTRTE